MLLDDKPKRPRSAFAYFSKGTRAEVMRQNPDMGFAEVCWTHCWTLKCHVSNKKAL